MAKIAKVKKRDADIDNVLEVSVHSRAARRGESPPPKDLLAKSGASETDYQPWLHNAQNAGIKKKKTKPASRQQKVRQQKALEKADAIVDKHERKVADSKSRAKRVFDRRQDWEELNEGLDAARAKKTDPAGKEHASKTAEGMEDVQAQVPDVIQPVPEPIAEDSAPEQGGENTVAGAAEEEIDEIT